jgi:peroxiredoxin
VTALAVGRVAPDFTLRDQNGRDISLKDFRGSQVVLVFVPFAFSAGCTMELQHIKDAAMAEGRTLEVIVIACDSHYTLRAWSEAHRYFGLVLSDFWPHGEVTQQYGVFDPLKGQALRATFSIDEHGRCQFAHVVSPSDIRSREDFAAAAEVFD